MKKFLFVFALIAFFCLGIQIYSNYVSSYDECLIAGRGCYARSSLQQFMQLSDNNRSGCYARSYLQQLRNYPTITVVGVVPVMAEYAAVPTDVQNAAMEH